MTVTTASGRTLNLHFMHASPHFETKPNASPTRKDLDAISRELYRHVTLCEISEQVAGEYTTTGEGFAVCNPLDRFLKAVGRKTALTYALADVFPSNNDMDCSDEPMDPSIVEFNRKERESVWTAYNLSFAPRLTPTDVLNGAQDIYSAILAGDMTRGAFQSYVKLLLKGFNKK